VIKGDGTTPVQFNEGDAVQYSIAGNFNLQIVFGTIGTSTLAVQVFANTQPTFEVYACAGNFAQIKVTDTNYDQYIINYNDATAEVTVPKGSLAKNNHSFASSGSKTFSVRGKNLNSADNCTSASQAIPVTMALTNATINQLEVSGASQTKLDYNSPAVSNQLNTQYKLEIAANSSTAFQQLQNIFNTTTSTVSSLKPDDNFYCFRMNTFDACLNAAVPASYSNIICSANFDLDIQSDVIKTKWITYSSAGSNVSNFSIGKNPGTSLSALSSETFKDDIDIICNTDYCYQLTTNYANGSRSISLQKCGKSFSNITPATTEDISIAVSQTGAALTWLQDPAFTSTQYTVYKSVNGNYSALANTTTPTHDDATYTTESGSCYKISYVDACLNSSPLSNEACPIRLSGTLQPDNSVLLTWSDYAGWKNGVSNYEIQKFTSQGQLLETITNGTANTYTDATLDFTNQTYVYIVTAFANDGGLVQSVSNAITVTKEPYLTYPTAFSPRGDEPKNQIFKVFGQYVSSFELRIFNRWGQELFYTDNFSKGWDGTYNGSLMPEGTYVFTAQITDLEGRTSDRSGTVVMLVKR
jgi:gliding motility-associated-like protein